MHILLFCFKSLQFNISRSHAVYNRFQRGFAIFSTDLANSYRGAEKRAMLSWLLLPHMTAPPTTFITEKHAVRCYSRSVFYDYQKGVENYA